MLNSCPVSEDDLINFLFGSIEVKLIGCILDETGITKLKIYQLIYPFLYVYGLVILAQTLCRWLS